MKIFFNAFIALLTAIAPLSAWSAPTAPAQANTRADLSIFKRLSSEEIVKLKENVISMAKAATDDPAANLSFGERLMLTQVLLDLSFRGLGANLPNGAAKDLPVPSLPQKDLAEKGLEPFEKNIFNFFATLHDKKKLRPFLRSRINMVNIALETIRPGSGLSPTARETILEFAAGNIESTIRVKGLTQDTKSIRYREWVDVNADWTKRLNSSQAIKVQVKGSGRADKLKILVDGPESFALRAQLFAQARESVDIMSWAIYDDVTGEWLLKTLSEMRASRPNVRVRIMIDGQTAKRPGYYAVADKIAALGIPLIKWVNPATPFVGLHRKAMIVDGRELIAGGMNFGDDYSHMNPEGPKWRDTDLYVSGDFVTNVAQKYFDETWNAAVKNMNLSLELSPPRPGASGAASTGPKVALLDQDPMQFPEGSPIFAALMSELKSATQSVDIENAYIVAIPAMVEAVRQAVARGVRVRVFTNSDQSVDEKVIGNAMKISAIKLLAAGAEIYLRKGTTLHSKFMIADQKRAYVMSYNIHPRSEKIENEMALVVDDTKTAAHLAATFERDITNTDSAIRVTDPAQLAVSPDMQLWVVLRLMYDQL